MYVCAVAWSECLPGSTCSAKRWVLRCALDMASSSTLPIEEHNLFLLWENRGGANRWPACQNWESKGWSVPVPLSCPCFGSTHSWMPVPEQRKPELLGAGCHTARQRGEEDDFRRMLLQLDREEHWLLWEAWASFYILGTMGSHPSKSFDGGVVGDRNAEREREKFLVFLLFCLGYLWRQAGAELWERFVRVVGRMKSEGSLLWGII